MIRTIRRRGALFATLFAATLLLSLTNGALTDVAHAETSAGSTTDDPAEAAAGWLAGNLDDDLQLVTGFGVSTGSTIDAVLSFDAAGIAGELSERVAANVAADAVTYASFPDESPDGGDAEVTTWSPGSLGKLLIMANSRPELDATDLGGVDAIDELHGIECTEGRANCDDDQLGAYKGLGAGADDTVSTLSQAFAVLGLAASADHPSDAAIAFLADQACDDGGFGFSLRSAGSDCASDADTTGLAAQALLAVDADAAQAAVDWLLANQDDSGGFVGFAGVDVNTTAYAVMALLAAGETDAADAGIQAIADLQAGCDAPAELIGALYFNEPDEEGETAADDVFATAQATPALAGQHLLEISGAGSSNDIPALDCGTDEPAGDTDGDDDVTEVTGEDRDGDEDAAATDADDDVLPETGTGMLIALLGLVVLAAGVGLLRLRRSPRSAR